MSLSDKEVLHLAKLSNLSLSPEEVDIFSKQLSEVVNYFDELKEVDTEGVEKASQTMKLTGVLRVDKIDNSRTLSQVDALSGTDKTHNGFFVVPPIFKE